MHPETYAARKGLPGIGHLHSDRFSHALVLESYEVNIASNMMDEDTFDLNIKLRDLDGKMNGVRDKPSSNLSFPPASIASTDSFTPQNTDLNEQMAGGKRPYKNDDANSPATKRRVTVRGPGGEKINSVTPLNKSLAGNRVHGNQKPVFIDLSCEKEQSVGFPIQPAKAIMKPLPPKSITGNFPHINSGEVYIILDPERSNYQYRLHKDVLTRLSPVFAKFIRLVCPEAMESLKAEATDAEVRFELFYSNRFGKWLLRRVPFTIWKQPAACVKAITTEIVSEETSLLGQVGSEVNSNASKPSIGVENSNPLPITITPGILSSGIEAAKIKIINITKDGESTFPVDKMNDTSTAVQGEESLAEKQIQAASTESTEFAESTEKSAVCDDLVSVKYEDICQNSDTNDPVKQNAAEDIWHGHSTITTTSTDQSSADLANINDITIISVGDEATDTVISPKSGDVKTLAEIGQNDATIHGQVIPPVVIAGADLGTSIVLEANSEEMLTAKAERDDSVTGIAPLDHETSPFPTETGSHQAPTKQDIISWSTPVSRTRPPIEICEAYNNLFFIFYSKPPVISNTSISIALKQCETLISVARMLQTVPVIRPYLSNAISRYGKQLYMAVAAEPFRWLRISIILESAAIFKESMIHIVGMYTAGPAGKKSLPAEIPQRMGELIIRKVRILDQQRMDVNERLFSSSIIIDSKTVTVSDRSNFSTWLVVQIWRDWFCQQMAGVHGNPLQTGQLYRTLAQSGDAYLPIAEVKAVVKEIREPVPVDAEELREDLGLLKKFAQNAAKELCENNSMVDVQEAGIGYLTCTQITDEELPWFEAEQ